MAENTAPPTRNANAYRLTTGVTNLTCFQTSTLPVSRFGSTREKSIGDNRTKMAATKINATTAYTSTVAVRCFKIRYTDPCARGKPPRRAPRIYQLLNAVSLQPNKPTHASVNVPRP